MRRSHIVGVLLPVVVIGSAYAQSRDVAITPTPRENRTALIIGNATYATSPLRNSVNDARAMAATLRDLGFDVLLRENAGEKDMKRAVEEFGDRLRAGGVGVFFFAGHGVQTGGRNYLVPVDASIRNERDLDIEGIDVNRVLSRMEDARNRLNIVILDACRDNPFGRTFRTATRGLASIDAPSGTLIAYATAPGRLAHDGHGANGLYTGELVKVIKEPGLRLEDVFKRVRVAVRRLTNGEQIPWEASSVEGDFVFNPKRAAALDAARPATPAGTGTSRPVDTARILARFRIPLPDDARIWAPGSFTSAAARTFLGMWFGVWDEMKLDHVLVVEATEGEKVRVIYAFGDSPEGSGWGIKRGFVRATGHFQDDDRTLTFKLHRLDGSVATVTYQMTRSGTLTAEYTYPTGSATATMTRMP